MPDRARNTGHADEEHDGPGGEQETQKPDQKAHYRSSVSTLCAKICGVYPNTATPPNGLPPRGRTIKGPADNIDRFRRPAVDFLYRCRCGQTRAFALDGTLFRLPLRDARRTFYLPGPAVASRLAKNVSIACAIDPTVRFRQFSDTRCSRSPLLET